MDRQEFGKEYKECDEMDVGNVAQFGIDREHCTKISWWGKVPVEAECVRQLK